MILRSVNQRMNLMKGPFNSVSFCLSVVERLVVQKRCEDADIVTRSSLISRAFITETEHGQSQRLPD